MWAPPFITLFVSQMEMQCDHLLYTSAVKVQAGVVFPTKVNYTLKPWAQYALLSFSWFCCVFLTRQPET